MGCNSASFICNEYAFFLREGNKIILHVVVMLLYYNGLTSCHPVRQQMLEARITCLRRLRFFFAHVADGCAFVRMISFLLTVVPFLACLIMTPCISAASSRKHFWREYDTN